MMTYRDRGARCVVLVGWAKGQRGVIVGRAFSSFFTVQLDNGERFCSKPGEVGPISETPFRRAVAHEAAND